jgi:TRAP-type transport system periplasmic protein
MATTTRVIAAALVAVAATGCSTTTDRSGGALAPTTLVLASNDGTDVHGALAQFVTLVEKQSGGRVRVQVSPKWRAKGEPRVLDDVAAGKADLAWSGTRAFDTVGVDTFRPLHAPFLISSYPAQRAVVPALAPELLKGLQGTGLTGLAVLADELRFPAGADGPLLAPGDFTDLNFGIMASNTQSAAVTALGARPQAITVPHPPTTNGLAALETMWNTYVGNDQHLFMPFVTANAVLWPRTTALVANTASFDRLSPQVREVVTKAATEAQLWSLDHADAQVADEMSRACAGGARIALASTEQLAALRRTVEPAYATLRATPAQAALLARIEALVSTADPAPAVQVPPGCAYAPGDEDRPAGPVLPKPLTGPGRPGELPEGTFRYSLTEREILDGLGTPNDGLGTTNEAFARANAGVWTWTLGDGRWSYVLRPTSQQVPEGFAGNTCEGYYDAHGDEVDFTTLTVYASGDCASPTWKAHWRAAGRDLVLDVTTDGDDLDFLFGSEAWQRIG